MKKLMVLISLVSSMHLYCPPEPGPKSEGHFDASYTRVTEIDPANKAAIKKFQAKTSTAEQESQQPKKTQKPTTKKASASQTEQEIGFNLSVEEPQAIATITHPETNGWFSSSKGTSIVTDNGNGTHSITTTSSKKDLSTWFMTKKSSMTEIIDTQGLTSNQVLTKIQDVSKSNDSSNIHDQIKTALQKQVASSPESFDQNAPEKRSIASLKNKNGLTYETTNLNDGSQQIKIHNIDGSTRIVTTSIDGFIESDATYDSNGNEIPDTNTVKKSVTKQLADGITNEIAFGDDGRPVSSHFYNKDGKLIKNINPKTAVIEDISYNKDETSIGVQRDSKGNILQNTLYDQKGNPIEAQIPGVTAEGKTTTHSMTYNKTGSLFKKT